MSTSETVTPAARNAFSANLGIAVCAGLFIAVLAVSAYWDRTIRVLHTFEAVPYAIAVALCFRGHKFGYALAFASGAFWLWSAGTLTSFVRNGFEQLIVVLRTGKVERPDILIAVPAALVTGGLAIFSLWGYALVRKKWSDVGLFAAALAGTTGWFLAIFAAFAPRYLAIFKRLLS